MSPMWECCQWPMLPVGLLVVGGWWVVCWLVGRDGRRGGRGAGFRFATWAAIRYSPRAKSPVGNWRFKSTAVTGEMSSCAAKMAALHVAARSVSGPYRGAVARGAGPTGGRSRGSATLPRGGMSSGAAKMAALHVAARHVPVPGHYRFDFFARAFFSMARHSSR